MKASTLLTLALSATLQSPCSAIPNEDASNQDILVDVAPDFVRPYVLPKYRGRAIKLTVSQIIRFSITTNSSGGAFSLIQHNGQQSAWLAARPHTHGLTHEHFYCARGRVQLWGMKNVTESSEEARVATVGDYGNVPPGVIHTFQLTDPDAQLTHVFHPGGFEHLFDVFSNGDHDTAGISSPYVALDTDPDPFGPFTPEQDELLRGLDLVAAPSEDYRPRRDFVNGTAGAGQKWHDGPNTLPNDATEPYFIAKDYGPKFLNSEAGYKIIQPLATREQSADGNFTMGTIVMSPKLESTPVSRTTLPHHFALQMDDGQLSLSIQGYKTVLMMHGDVAFIPAGTPFEYYATVPYTKFLYMNAGAEGLEAQLLKDSKEWSWPAYPDV
ncbi:hypothetical protein CDD82_2924 [Ophiocordyceps australis]|uniref:Cupin 2 conserved barrel domain-containing protein n=1 Tax=Ophiocordyceps australis TaxID=1399860 RepID=A0A2C5ZG16_9HYPO|nr:hypothetical protein CDD82_2924 [Ophiocordyceps australis]